MSNSTRRGGNQPRRHQFRVVQRSAHEWGWELVNLGSGDVVARNGHGYSGQRQARAAVNRLRRLVVGHHLGHGYLDPAVEVVPLRAGPGS